MELPLAYDYLSVLRLQSITNSAYARGGNYEPPHRQPPPLAFTQHIWNYNTFAEILVGEGFVGNCGASVCKQSPLVSSSRQRDMKERIPQIRSALAEIFIKWCGVRTRLYVWISVSTFAHLNNILSFILISWMSS